EELMKEFAAPYFQKKMPLRGVVFPTEERMKYFNTLLCMNVDEIVFVENGLRHVITLSDFIKKQDFSDRPKHMRPIDNPGLLLSGTYFMQEASRPVPADQKENMSDLEEELAANMVKATYLMPVELLEGEESDAEKLKANRFKIPILKTQNGDVFQPLFTDNVELSKYNRENKYKCLAVPFVNLEKILVPEAKAYMLNPNGFHIMMPKDLLKGLKIRFGIEDPKKPEPTVQ
ncbi:MAG: SseB family protein, partial [Parasporobacterium sp.]|nr:SseB family protein [Parasporobacterium sp.]